MTPRYPSRKAPIARRSDPGRQGPEPIARRRVAHDDDPLGRDAAALRGQSGVRIVGDQDERRAGIRGALERAGQADERAARPAPAPLGDRQFRVGVVLVVDVARAPQAGQATQEEEEVGRVAAVHDVDPAADAKGEQPGRREDHRRHVFHDVPGDPGRRALRIAQDADPVTGLDQGAHVVPTARRDDRHPVARVGQRPGLLPDPSIERDRQVLVEDDDVRAA